MTILITGGAGFIGTNFILYWLEAHPGDRVVCLDALTYAGRRENLQGVEELRNFRFVQGNICDRNLVYELFRQERPETVVNFAAESHVDRSITGPEVFLQTNVVGTSVLMDACREYGVQRFHQVSTDEVYGDLPLEAPEQLFAESSPLRPSSPYSSSKAGADLLVLAYARTYGLNVTISRCSNNYGPYQHEEKLIPLMVSRALRNEPLPVYGDGRNVRDWLHVEDHCRAIDVILHQGRPGEVYNVGGRNEVANIDLVCRICQLLGKPDSLITFVADRKGHDRRYAIDATKLEQELGWQPEVRFEEGLRKTVEWYVRLGDEEAGTELSWFL